MLTFRQLLTLHGRGLLLDSCSATVHALTWMEGGVRSAASEPAEASCGLPRVAGRVLGEAGWRVGELDAVVFCAGPGSVLGVRLAAATVRAWRALKPELMIYSYRSLSLAAAGLGLPAGGRGILSDARQDTWHAVLPEAPFDIVRLPNAELSQRAGWLTPAGLRRWTSPPAGVELEEIRYDPAGWLQSGGDAPLFEPAAEPEAYLSQAPRYVEWEPHVHQAVKRT